MTHTHKTRAIMTGHLLPPQTIDYKKGEDPHLLRTGKYAQGSSPSLIALSPNAEVVAVATTNSLAFYSALTGDLDYKIENIYNGKITSILFDSLGKYIFTAGDKHIRVFHNVTGYRCAITTANNKLKQNQTSATKERLQKLIADSESFLQTIDTKA
ncbi:putative cellular response to glucose starvation [Trypoxylus dichotomus]